MNILNDVIEMKFTPLADVPFNDVDSLIFSTLAYFPINTLIGPEGSKRFCEIDGSKIETPDNVKKHYRPRWQLMKDALNSGRYVDFVMSDFVESFCEESEKQFSAVCFSNDKFVYVAFRGTDGTLVGWKEDFNMAYMDSVPAQDEAVKYLKHVAKKHKHKSIIVGGHSKGGNLAIYAASKCGFFVRHRIKAIFNHDGPGFKKEFFDNHGYKKIASKINKTVPQSSIIGMLLDNPHQCKIVASDGFMLHQHNSLNWHVSNHDFVQVEKIGETYKIFNNLFDSWLANKSMKERKDTIDLIFELLDIMGVENFDVKEIGIKYLLNRKAVSAKFDTLSPEMQEFMRQLKNEVFDIGKSSFFGGREYNKNEKERIKQEEKQEKIDKKQLAKQLKQERKAQKEKEKQDKQ